VVPSSDLGRRTDVTLHHGARGPRVASHLTASRRGFSFGEWLVQPSACSCKRTALARNEKQESRVHLTAFFPSLIHCLAVPRPL
jgi:hypothetical protein